ncbi:MAG: hypothetical protein ACK5D7_03550 [Planctomycetota bacterium]
MSDDHQITHHRSRLRLAPSLRLVSYLRLAPCLLLCGMLVCLSGCGLGLPEFARNLVGTWELDQPERLAERINQLPADRSSPVPAGSSLPVPEPEDEELPSEPSSPTRGPGMALEFRADGTFQSRTDFGQLQQAKQGSWKFISASSDGKTLAIRCVLNGQSTEVEVEFVEADVVSLAPPNLSGLNSKLRFRRAQ